MPLITTSHTSLQTLAPPSANQSHHDLTPCSSSKDRTSSLDVGFRFPRWHDHDPQENTDYIFLFDEHKRFIVQVTAVVAACISLLLVSVAFFWFTRMRKRFRHKLIMLLILGDWLRALWFLVFAIVSIRRGTIYTHTHFCQAAGYWIQMATEISDLSVLFISIHGATQIFKPPISIAGGDDLMYKYRHWIYAFILLVPQIFASLPFADPNGAGYLSQGAFCTLPIRPIWYRLALAWVPRLIIWITILGLAIAIYIHVHREFAHFSAAFRHPSTTSTSFMSETFDGSPSESEKRRNSSPIPSARRQSLDASEQATAGPSAFIDLGAPPRPAPTREISSIDPISVCPGEHASGFALLPPVATHPPEGRRSSRVRIEIPMCLPSLDADAVPADPNKRKSVSDSLRSWRGSLREGFEHLNGSHRSSLTGSLHPERPAHSHRGVESSMRRFRAHVHAGHRHARRESDPMEAQMRQKRTHIRRQLRQVFVYPLVYICMWLIPFIVLCITYNDKIARRPPFVLSMLNNFCLCFIGAVNSVVFSQREKPWRHIEDNPTRAFWSSFRCHCTKRGDPEDDADAGNDVPVSPHQRGRDANWSQERTSVRHDPATVNSTDPAAIFAPPLTLPVARLPRRPSTAPPFPHGSTSGPGHHHQDAHAHYPPWPLRHAASASGLAPSSSQRPHLPSRTSYPPTSQRGFAAVARRSIKRASAMVAATSGPRESDAQRAAKEMAYARLAWEREQHAAEVRTSAAATAGEEDRG